MRSPGTFDLRAALTSELAGAAEALSLAEAEPKALHRCRVQLKRARALAQVGAEAAPGLAAVFTDTARAAMRTLAPARSADALETAARALAKAEAKKTVRALRFTAESLRAAHAASPRTDYESVAANIHDLIALAQVWPETSARQIARGAKEITRTARRARRRACGTEGARVRHDWRKAEKARLYAAEILGPAWPGGKRRRTSAKLGEALGRERDLHLLIAHIKINPPPRGAKRALKALKRKKARLAARANALGKSLRESRA